MPWLTVVLSAAALVCFSQAANYRMRSGRLMCVDAQRRFDPVDEGRPAEVRFELVNDSHRVIDLLGTTASCSCTTPKFEKQSLAPGDTTDVVAVLNTSGRSGMVSSSVNVTWGFYGDRHQHSLPLMLWGQVRPHFVCDPRELTFTSNRPATARVAIRRRPAGDGSVRSIRATSHSLSASVAGETDNRRSIIEVSYTGDARLIPGQHSREAIVISTDGTPPATVRIPITIVHAAAETPSGVDTHTEQQSEWADIRE